MADFSACCDVLQADLAAMRLRKSPPPPPSPPPDAAALMRRRRARGPHNRGAAALTAFKADQGLTFEELAPVAGVSVGSIVNWMQWGRRPSAENAARLEETLGIPVSWWREPPPEEGASC